jgi:hypothetical protein
LSIQKTAPGEAKHELFLRGFEAFGIDSLAGQGLFLIPKSPFVSSYHLVVTIVLGGITSSV